MFKFVWMEEGKAGRIYQKGQLYFTMGGRITDSGGITDTFLK